MKFSVLGRDILIGKDVNQFTGRTDDLLAVFSNKYDFDYKNKNQLQAYKGLVYACISLMAEGMADYEPILQQKKGDQWVAIDHEFLDLLNQPTGKDLKAAAFSNFELWEATLSYFALQGDCYWYMARGVTTGRPREIIVLRSDRVGTDIDPDTGDVNGYFVRRPGYGDPIPLEVDEVLRFGSFNPNNPYKGIGNVAAGSDYILTDENTAEYTKNFFGNNAGLSGVLNIKGEVTKGAFRKFVRAWREKYEGVNNAGKVAILRDSDASFTQVGLGIDQLDMGGLRSMSLKDVCMMFKVPPELLGRMTEGSGLGRANIETLEYIFSKYNLDKKMTRFDNVIMFALQRYYGIDPRSYRLIHRNIIPEDKEYNLEVRDKAVDRWLTRDEIRGQDGLDGVSGGDQLFIPIQQVPISDAGLDPASDSSSSSKGIKVTVVRKVEPKKKDSASRVAKNKRQDAERYRLSLERLAKQYEKRYRKKLAPVIEAQRKDAVASLAAHASAAKAFDLFDDSDYDQKMKSVLTPVLEDLASVQGGLGLAFAGDSDNEFLLTVSMRQFVERATLKMAQGVNDRTLERLNDTLAAGVQAGESLSKLTDRVNEVYDQLSGMQSERIARTETLKTSNMATQWAYQQTGAVTGKQWVVNPGACPECESFDGKTVPLDDAYVAQGDSYTYTDESGEEQTKVNTYDTVEVPPLHPNCRCTIIPIS